MADSTGPHLQVPDQVHAWTHNLGEASGRILHSILGDDQIEEIEHFKYEQNLLRKLTVTSIIGLGFSLMGVPFGLSSTLWISLVDGGNVTILYGWLVVVFFSLCVVLSLSEIISKYPTSGGVYHFSAILASPKHSLRSSWFTGWLLLIGTMTYAVSIMFLGAQFVLSIVGLKDSAYHENVFYVLLVYMGLLLVCGFINWQFSGQLERINKMCILWSIYTVLAIDFLLIFYAKRTNSIKEILTNFDNSRSGWPDALAFMVGLQSSSFTLTGYGMLFSMTDEVKNPERNMPKGAISATVLAGVMGVIFIIPILTILPELTLLLDKTPEVMPVDLVFKIATESYVISFLLALLLVGTLFFQAIGSLTTASRATYAFARDGGLPFQHLWVEVDPSHDGVPKNALYLSMVMCAILSLLALVSTSAFNAFLGSSVICLALANGVPIMLSMLNGRKSIKGGAFRLLIFGWVVNALSVLWIAFLTVILCLPPAIKHLTWFSMNYALVVIAAFLGVATVGYITWGSANFTGPLIDTDYFELHNLSARGMVNNDAFVPGLDDESESGEAENGFRALPDQETSEVMFERTLDERGAEKESVGVGESTATEDGKVGHADNDGSSSR